ncbi:peptidoglycan editing factor PgeF [Thermomonas sp. HDW16]|uniref:peptidoglycan editing factor PgeF n=1 Tax=Thermomonas sp. HDW16 TaxID=2714945 RepID=UPI00140C38B1|nr:peptidoglycan editing factor PgeF [Thermomonas sp. HDW16]QIL21406.1 peptidoglycan editing factor PgeF [Thermomonas sp. HDW16]
MKVWIDADWPAPPGVRALTTTRYGLGVSAAPFDTFNLGLRSGDEIEAALENRRQLEVALGLPSAPRWLKQVHGVDVVIEPDFDEPEADAAVTSETGKVLAILTADCLPVVFAARDGSEIAAAHAGWPGLSTGMLEATLAAMRAPAAQLQAWIGPAAGPQRYEIGDEVRERFMAHDKRAAMAFVATRPGHWWVDMFAIARMRMADAGIDPQHIHGGGVCTISDSLRFFSHRRDQRTGRMATLVWMSP